MRTKETEKEGRGGEREGKKKELEDVSKEYERRRKREIREKSKCFRVDRTKPGLQTDLVI